MPKPTFLPPDFLNVGLTRSESLPRPGRLVVLVALVAMTLAFAGSVAINSLFVHTTGGLFPVVLSSISLIFYVLLVVGYVLGRVGPSLAVSALTLWNISYIVTKLAYLTLFRHDPSMLAYNLSSEFLYTTATPMLAYSMPVTKLVRKAVWWQVYAFTAITALFLLLGKASDPREVYSLLQLCLLNWGVVFSTRSFSRTLGRLWQAKDDNVTLNQLAFTDELTGLLNRRGMERELQRLLDEAGQRGSSVITAFIDLDGFKPINDTLGHQIGDEILVKVAQRLSKIVDGWAVAARVSGDEFVLAAHLLNPDLQEQNAQQLQEVLSRPITVEGHRVILTASMGISIYPQDGRTVQEILRRADIAMFSVKHSGKNKVHFYGKDLHAESEYRSLVMREMVGVQTRGELQLVFQPIYDLSLMQVKYSEALLRWHHPTLGSISPSVFIPIAESSGMIVQIGVWVLTEALAAVKNWRGQGFPEMRVAVNVSPLQLIQPGFSQLVATELHKAGLPGNALELEITEGLALSDRAATIRLLNELRQMGVSLALDDFGEGFSSLSHLRDLPVQSVKLDRSFVLGLSDTDPAAIRYAHALINATMNLAETLKLKVIAEGVEDAAQRDILLALGCRYAQGFYFMRPCTGEEFLAALKED